MRDHRSRHPTLVLACRRFPGRRQSQRYHDPLVHALNDLQEFAQTHYQVSLRKVRVPHSIMTHYLLLYFPEADRDYTHSRAQWFTRLLHRFPCPAAITRYSREAFEQESWTIVGRKVNKHGVLHDLYVTASQSVGLPVSEESEAIQMFRVILTEHEQLCATRAAIEQQADQTLHDHPDYQRLRTLPGVVWDRFSCSPSWRKPAICVDSLTTASF